MTQYLRLHSLLEHHSKNMTYLNAYAHTRIYCTKAKPRFQNISPRKEAAWSFSQESTDLEESQSTDLEESQSTLRANSYLNCWLTCAHGCCRILFFNCAIWFKATKKKKKSPKMYLIHKEIHTVHLKSQSWQLWKKNMIKDRNVIMSSRTILSILRQFIGVLGAKQHRKEINS